MKGLALVGERGGDGHSILQKRQHIHVLKIRMDSRIREGQNDLRSPSEMEESTVSSPRKREGAINSPSHGEKGEDTQWSWGKKTLQKKKIQGGEDPWNRGFG